MLMLREITHADLAGLLSLSQAAGHGLTSLPRDEAFLEERVHLSVTSFHRQLAEPGDEYYLFVLVDTQAPQTILGTSAIKATVGRQNPFYSYQRRTLQSPLHLSQSAPQTVLELVQRFNGCSELCGLFLSHAARKSHHAALLSRGRMVFMAQAPHRFSRDTIAEIRGVSNTKGYAPFWEGLGKHFYPMSFVEADYQCALGYKDIIADYHPKYAVYESVLPATARAVIGQPHRNARPALSMLKREGFYQTEYIDIFDGGPTIAAKTAEIRTLKTTQRYALKENGSHHTAQPFLIARSNPAQIIIDDAYVEGEALYVSNAVYEMLQTDSVFAAPV